MVTRLIWLSKYRRTHGLPPIQEFQHDWDLLPIAIPLWLTSVVRVAMGVMEGEVFQTEATLALACVILIPLWVLSSWMRRHEQSSIVNGSHSPGGPPGARVIPMPSPRRPAEAPPLHAGGSNRSASKRRAVG